MLTPWGKPRKAFQCPEDPKLAWAITYPKGCHDSNPASHASSVMNVITDIVIYLLPFPSLLSLQLNRKNKSMFWRKALLGVAFGQNSGVNGALTLSRIVALMLVFSVGSVAVIASIVRLSSTFLFTRSNDKACEFKSRRRPYSCHHTAH